MTTTSPARLTGRTALVTGAGSGLGAEIASRLAAEGARLACADINVAAAASTAARITADGGAAFALGLDVTDWDAQQEVLRRVLDAYGAVDVCVANAGVAGAGSAHEINSELWDRVLAVNLTGVWLTAKAVLPHMLERGSGSLITMASVAALIGVPAIAAYTAAKGGVAAMTRQMAVDYAPSGVRVNAIAPGTVPTPLVAASHAGRAEHAATTLENMVALHPMGRLGAAADVAAAAAFLASDDSAWVTGTVLAVDGGRTAS